LRKEWRIVNLVDRLGTGRTRLIMGCAKDAHLGGRCYIILHRQRNWPFRRKLAEQRLEGGQIGMQRSRELIRYGFVRFDTVDRGGGSSSMAASL
jgi:hypothetical protein